jgi:hypothetical protein
LLFASLSAAVFGQSGPNTVTIKMANVTVILEKTIDAKSAKAGDHVLAKMLATVTLNDGTNVPRDSVLEGQVDSATPAHDKGDSMLELTFDKVRTKGGKEIPVKVAILSVGALNPGSSSPSGGPNSDSYDAQRPSYGGGNITLPIPGMTVVSSPNGSDSGTIIQAKRNVHLSNADQIQVALAVAVAP